MPLSVLLIVLFCGNEGYDYDFDQIRKVRCSLFLLKVFLSDDGLSFECRITLCTLIDIKRRASWVAESKKNDFEHRRRLTIGVKTRRHEPSRSRIFDDLDLGSTRKPGSKAKLPVPVEGGLVRARLERSEGDSGTFLSAEVEASLALPSIPARILCVLSTLQYEPFPVARQCIRGR